MLDVLSRIFSKDNVSSKDVAKERLRLVLVHDRSTITPEYLNLLKEDLLKVIREYLEIDEEALQVNLANEDSSFALVANIPVKGFKRHHILEMQNQ
ncbi:MAG: cell division topological specificity factor MinE [Syntrophomonadaceae bacterium]